MLSKIRPRSSMSGATASSRRSPAIVKDSAWCFRSKRASPILFSRVCTRRLSADGDRARTSAAFFMEPIRATVTNASIAPSGGSLNIGTPHSPSAIAQRGIDVVQVSGKNQPLFNSECIAFFAIGVKFFAVAQRIAQLHKERAFQASPPQTCGQALWAGPFFIVARHRIFSLDHSLFETPRSEREDVAIGGCRSE